MMHDKNFLYIAGSYAFTALTLALVIFSTWRRARRIDEKLKSHAKEI